MTKTVPSPVIIIFGITGDLSRRKLLPALYHLVAHDVLAPSTRIIGTSRHHVDADELLDDVELCVLEAEHVCDPAGIEKMRAVFQTCQFDPTERRDYEKLSAMLDSFDDHLAKRERLLYMALPPAAYTGIVTHLGKAGLNDTRTRLLIEKPFGEDTVSAKALTAIVENYFTESQIYRIDHYLAKETAQNLLAFRLHNPIFASLWNSDHIDTVHIRAAEKIGIENRIEFYEQTGALRDIIQSHLLQLLAVVMMDQPPDSTSESIHEGKQVFLRSLLPADPARAARAQYDGYKKEAQNPNSVTETYARIELTSRDSQWRDTRIILETGKALNEKLTEVIVQFKHQHERHRNQLRFRIQPHEGISLDLVVKTPGFDDNMQPAELNFSYTTIFKDQQHPDAYERVIMDAIKADQALFTSSRELQLAWEIVQPVIDEWAKNNQGLMTYEMSAAYIPNPK